MFDLLKCISMDFFRLRTNYRKILSRYLLFSPMSVQYFYALKISKSVFFAAKKLVPPSFEAQVEFKNNYSQLKFEQLV